MRYLPLFCLLLLAACMQNKPGNTTVLKAANLESQFYNINASKDTILHTPKGAIIKITKGSLQAGGGGNTVKVEIKEAYTIADMVLAGLTTQAGAEPLSSGGMIYINPAPGQKATILKPLEVSIPTPYVQEGMQLYKGVAKADSSIDWTAPTPLADTAHKLTLADGKALYTNNCTSCHNMDRDATGPQLVHVYKRRNWDWLKRFTYNSSKMIASGDRLANCLFEHWGRTVMTSFPMSEDSLLAIYKYIEYESEKYDPATIPDFAKCLDSCDRYIRRLGELSAKRAQLVADNGQLVTIIDRSAAIPAINTATNTNRVQANNAQSEYYRITVSTFGWYNIDIEIKGMRDFKESTLTVRMTGAYAENFNMYLIVPRDRIYVAGGLLAGKDDEFGFYEQDGKIPLPQGIQAYILALGDTKAKLTYSIVPFTTKTQQELSVSMTATTMQALTIEIQKLSLSGMGLAIGESKNADEIRKTDTALSQLQMLKPKGCDCDCGLRIEGIWE